VTSRHDGSAHSGTVDLRLLAAAVAGWLAVLWALGRDTRTVVVVAVGAVVLAAVLFASRRHVRGLAPAMWLLVVALLLIPLAARQAHAHASPLWQLATERAQVHLELVTSSDPTPLATRGPDGRPRIVLDAAARSVTEGASTRDLDGSLVVLADAAGWQDVLPGQRVIVDGQLAPPLDDGELAVALFAESAPTPVGGPPWYQRAAGVVRASLRAACAGLPTQVRGLLPGLIDGDTTQLDPVLKEHFRLAGLTHLVAVSGTNLSLLLGAVLLLLRRLRARPWICALVGVLVVVAFVLVARPSPSVLRAAAMGLVTLAGLASGRPRAALPAVGFAVIALLLYDPFLAVDAGFAMSVLATAALLLLAPRWAAALRGRHVPMGLAEATAVAAAAHMVTAPIAAAISGTVSLSAIPANILAEPLVAPATLLGFVAALVAPFSLTLGSVLAWLASWPCRWLVLVADHLGTVHGGNLPWPGGMAGGLLLVGVILAVLVAARHTAMRTGLVAVAVVALVVQVPIRNVAAAWPPTGGNGSNGWVMTVCDVDQGDGIVLNAGGGAAVVIDTGPDPVRMDRCLRDLGIRQIPLLAISHFHLDHVGGVTGALRGRPVGRVITGPLADPESGVQILQAALPVGTSVTTPVPGQRFTVGTVALEVLGPTTELHNTRSDPNNDSLVLRATVDGVRILLPGDAEIEEQQSLLDAGVDLRADVLKVPHHGSAYSLPEFLSAVHAKVALVSCGVNNDYGHPAPSLLETMNRLGVPLRRTDKDGDIAVRGPPEKLTVVVRGKAASAVTG
jgi:competence protein ComEC